MTNWDSLRVIAAEARESANRPGVECPNDGTKLRTGPNGEMYCPFDGWRGTAAQAMPSGPRIAGYGIGYYGISPYGV